MLGILQDCLPLYLSPLEVHTGEILLNPNPAQPQADWQAVMQGWITNPCTCVPGRRDSFPPLPGLHVLSTTPKTVNGCGCVQVSLTTGHLLSICVTSQWASVPPPALTKSPQGLVDCGIRPYLLCVLLTGDEALPVKHWADHCPPPPGGARPRLAPDGVCCCVPVMLLHCLTPASS